MTTLSRPSRFVRTAASAALGIGVTLALPRTAEACGGFFCAASPVDQTAEHILFSVNPDHTITAYVQIRYSGDKDGFAWIVPVPGIPRLAADFPELAFNALDNATQPQYNNTSCQNKGVLFGGAPGNAADPSASSDGVTVLAKQVVGPFETVTLESTSATVLVDWLQENQFRFSDSMAPLLQPYVEGGLNFVAMKLTADKSASDIKPLVMNYDGDRPMIPLRLTAVAAQPEMGIVTWILGNRRWAPENYVDLAIPDNLIEFDTSGRDNYLTLVSRETDKVGGLAFVTEYANRTAPLVETMKNQFAPSEEGIAARDALVGLLGKQPYITRLYTRMSAEEMIDDPLFMVASTQGDVANVHDIMGPTTSCPETTNPCNFTYCGRSGACIATDVATPGGGTTTLPACVCTNDATARRTTTGAFGSPAMYCEPVAMNLGDSGSANGSLLLVDACESFDCGVHGACVAMNGNPTCQCEGGYGAVASTSYDPTTGQASDKITCEKVQSVPAPPRLPKIGQTRLSLASAGSDSSCSVHRGAAPSGGTAVWLFGAAAALMVSRRRRSH